MHLRLNVALASAVGLLFLGGGALADEESSTADPDFDTTGKQLSPVNIGRDWAHEDQSGDSLVWTGQMGGCDGIIVKYKINNLGNHAPGWNDRITSAQGLNGCSRYRHFEHTSFGGDVRVCDPSCPGSMGDMNNKTSSLKWRHPDLD